MSCCCLRWSSRAIYAETSRGPFQTALLSLRTVMRSVGVAGARMREGESPGGRGVVFVIVFASAAVLVVPSVIVGESVPFVMMFEGMGFGG